MDTKKLKAEPKPTLEEALKENRSLAVRLAQTRREHDDFVEEAEYFEKRTKDHIASLQSIALRERLMSERRAGYIDRILEDDVIRDGSIDAQDMGNHAPNTRRGPTYPTSGDLDGMGPPPTLHRRQPWTPAS